MRPRAFAPSTQLSPCYRPGTGLKMAPPFISSPNSSRPRGVWFRVRYDGPRQTIWARSSGLGPSGPTGRTPPDGPRRGGAVLETACSVGEFRCRDGTCIGNSSRCNQFVDCEDASDEMNCSERCPILVPCRLGSPPLHPRSSLPSPWLTSSLSPLPACLRPGLPWDSEGAGSRRCGQSPPAKDTVQLSKTQGSM